MARFLCSSRPVANGVFLRSFGVSPQQNSVFEPICPRSTHQQVCNLGHFDAYVWHWLLFLAASKPQIIEQLYHGIAINWSDSESTTLWSLILLVRFSSISGLQPRNTRTVKQNHRTTTTWPWMRRLTPAKSAQYSRLNLEWTLCSLPQDVNEDKPGVDSATLPGVAWPISQSFA